MNDPKLPDLPSEALKYLALEFGAMAALPAARPASGWGAWWWWLVNRERERRRGNSDAGLPPEIVGFDDLDTAELRALRDIFDEMALLADLHDQDAMCGWCRKIMGRFAGELAHRAQARADLQAHIDAYRRDVRPLGSPADTSHIPPWKDVSSPPGSPPERNPWM